MHRRIVPTAAPGRSASPFREMRAPPFLRSSAFRNWGRDPAKPTISLHRCARLISLNQNIQCEMPERRGQRTGIACAFREHSKLSPTWPMYYYGQTRTPDRRLADRSALRAQSRVGILVDNAFTRRASWAWAVRIAFWRWGPQPFGGDHAVVGFEPLDDAEMFPDPVADPAPVGITLVFEQATQTVLLLDALEEIGVAGETGERLVKCRIEFEQRCFRERNRGSGQGIFMIGLQPLQGERIRRKARQKDVRGLDREAKFVAAAPGMA